MTVPLAPSHFFFGLDAFDSEQFSELQSTQIILLPLALSSQPHIIAVFRANEILW